jgi:redox-sensitive bicupin YhaK (pirin superfamily)
MITVRPAEARGRTAISWLDSRHTFSFNEYYDPQHMGFRTLRVINDDRVLPASGFGTHGHRDMEILTYVLSGGLAHKDSLGTGSVIRPADLQRMSAGTGIRHSEWNASETEPVRFLQIWLLPAKTGLPPSYEQITFDEAGRRNRLQLIASGDGRAGSLTVHQDANVHALALTPGGNAALELAAGRYAWVQLARGSVVLNGTTLREGDGAALTTETRLQFVAADDGAELLAFDLA